MPVNLERAAMRGRLEEKKALAARLRLRIEGRCVSIRYGLNVAITKVDDLDIPVVAEQMDELVTAWGELQATLSEISRLERELA